MSLPRVKARASSWRAASSAWPSSWTVTSSNGRWNLASKLRRACSGIGDPLPRLASRYSWTGLGTSGVPVSAVDGPVGAPAPAFNGAFPTGVTASGTAPVLAVPGSLAGVAGAGAAWRSAPAWGGISLRCTVPEAPPAGIAGISGPGSRRRRRRLGRVLLGGRAEVAGSGIRMTRSASASAAFSSGASASPTTEPADEAALALTCLSPSDEPAAGVGAAGAAEAPSGLGASATGASFAGLCSAAWSIS